MMAGGFSDSREVRVTVEVVDGFTPEGKERVLFKEEFLLGSLEEGLDSAAEIEQVLDDLGEAHLSDRWVAGDDRRPRIYGSVSAQYGASK